MRLMLSRVIQGETPLPPRGSKIERARERGSGGGVERGLDKVKVRRSPLFWFSGRLFLLLQLMEHHKFLLQHMSPRESNWFHWV